MTTDTHTTTYTWVAPDDGEWTPTHIIKSSLEGDVPVMLCEGAAYQREEWDAQVAAAYEYNEDTGEWLVYGQPFTGRIIEINAIDHRDRIRTL